MISPPKVPNKSWATRQLPTPSSFRDPGVTSEMTDKSVGLWVWLRDLGARQMPPCRGGLTSVERERNPSSEAVVDSVPVHDGD